jgi:membrane-associated phospholipid phosphatase
MGWITKIAGSGAAVTAAAVGLVLVAVGLSGADAFFARADLAGGTAWETLSRAVALLDLAAGKGISNFLLGTILVLAALAWNALNRRRLWTGGLLYVGIVQLATTLIADFAKPPFGRLRPFQALARDEWADGWFMGPDYGSFPSGHAAFYAGLCLPLALLFPRWAAALLAVPLLVGAERVLSHDHYVSDIGASFLLAAALAAGLGRLVSSSPILEPALRPAPSTSSGDPR